TPTHDDDGGLLICHTDSQVKFGSAGIDIASAVRGACTVPMPPVTGQTTPVTPVAVSREAVTWATSSGSSSRWIGIRSVGVLPLPVSVGPGATATTPMPSAARSAAVARVSVCIAPLVVAYIARSGRPKPTTMEQVFTMTGTSERRRYGRAARVTRTAP